ncbi:hypothetical protein PRIPAC_91128 [Pristionchus pacificus]|uniref:G protein-coupled receptor n=1 Tax=Pristionchus pacificus TaxID=54126 RepID=A0A2A6CXG4_PRIPA|nr:hypothetical protein PRIPAC_91128 [Pristionchus pacificus]|eukprot:PDM82865.1 G protein-coupled receptor [Pristionchus pacificus]
MQIEMCGSLAFGLDWDRDYFLPIVRLARQIYWPLSVFLLNPTVIYVLIRKTQMSLDCKAAFVAHHVVLICFDVYNGLLYQMYPLAPLPIFICTGLFCTNNVSPRILLTILAFWTITMCVPYLFIMTRMHQKMLFHDSPFKVSMRAQIGVLSALITTLLANLVGFAIWTDESAEKTRILQTPSVSWTVSVSHNFLVLGAAPGDVGDFIYELILLAASIFINFSYYIFITYHAVFKLGKQMKRTSLPAQNSKTRDAQLRFVYSLTIQATLTGIFFITPLALLFIALLVDFSFMPGILLGISRPLFLLNQQKCVQFDAIAATATLARSNREVNSSIEHQNSFDYEDRKLSPFPNTEEVIFLDQLIL